MTNPKKKPLKKKTAPEGEGGGKDELTEKEFLEALDAVISSEPKTDQEKKKTSE